MARAILTDAERVGWERFPADPDAEAIGAAVLVGYVPAERTAREHR